MKVFISLRTIKTFSGGQAVVKRLLLGYAIYFIIRVVGHCRQLKGDVDVRFRRFQNHLVPCLV